MVTFGVKLRHFGLLLGCEHLIDRRFGLSVREGLLARQDADLIGCLLHRRRVIRANRGLQIGVRGFPAAVNRGLIRRGVGKDRGDLGLLSRSERQHRSQIS